MSNRNGSTRGAWPDDATVEALLAGTGPAGNPLTGVLTALRAAGERGAPEPSAELAALFAGGAAVLPIPRRRRGRVVAGLVIAGGTTFALSGVAAAHDALPGPVQRVVTDIYNTVTPIHIDQRHDPTPARPTDTAPPSSVPTEPGDDQGGQSTGDDHGPNSGPGGGEDEGGQHGDGRRGGGDGGSASNDGSGDDGSGDRGHGDRGGGGSGDGGSSGGEHNGGSDGDGGGSD